MANAEFEALLMPMKRAAAALRDADVEFMLAGGLAAWARGGPASDHDVDFCVRPEDADKALVVLEAAGFEIERPPEGWLYKAFLEGELIDVIFYPAGLAIDDEAFARADRIDVQAVSMLVMRPTDVLLTKLMAMNDHYLDFESALLIARTLREQIEWERLRERTRESPYARAFLTLLDELAIPARSALIND